ncbi:MAG: glycosyltransferase [Herpetosiphon sp.]
MKIVFVMTMGIERPSGRRYFGIARALCAAGHHVRLLALHPDLPRCANRRFVRDGVEVWYVGQMHARKIGKPSRFAPMELFQILVASTLGMLWGIVCSPADIYHLGKPQPINGLAAIFGVMLLRGRRFYVDCDDDEVGSNQLTASWQRGVFAFWQWLVPRLARGITVNTSFLAARHAGRRCPVVLVPNGVDLERQRRLPPAQSAALRTALRLDECRVIAYAGTVALHNHPVDLLIRAVALLPPALNLRLLLIGDGEDLAAVRRLAHDRGIGHILQCTGQVPHAAVAPLLALAEVSVDPVVDNTVAKARSPLKIVESLAIGIPVLTGDVGDRAATLRDSSAGLVVAPGDPNALARGILAVLDRAPTEEATVRRQAEPYSWSRLAERWVTVYDSRP